MVILMIGVGIVGIDGLTMDIVIGMIHLDLVIIGVGMVIMDTIIGVGETK